jgi:hypothetical protein
VREYHRFVAPPPLIHDVARLHRQYRDAVKAHYANPAHCPLPAPFVLPTPAEGFWELVVETDSRNQDQALELLRLRWQDNPTATAECIVAVLADWPVYRTDAAAYRTEQIKHILRQALRFLRNPPLPATAPAMPGTAGTQTLPIPANLRLLETEFDLYQRHLTCVYISDSAGRAEQLNLPLDNDFARLRSTNRKFYDADKYNPRYAAQLAAGADPHSPVQRSLRFLARQVAAGNQVKLVTDKTAAHGDMLLRAVAALVPEEAAKVKAANPAAGSSGTHCMDDRDDIDEYDRAPRFLWRLDTAGHRKLRAKLGLPWDAPIDFATLRATKLDAEKIGWHQLYWLPRRHLCYLVCSVRRFSDRNHIAKHVVIYQPVTVMVGGKVVRRQRAGWLVVVEDDLRKLSQWERKVVQYDGDGNISGYSDYRKAPKTFYTGKVRNTFAWVYATMRSSKPFQRLMSTITDWEYEREHGFEHRTLKNSTLAFDRQDGKRALHADEYTLSNGRFDRNDDLLNPTYEEFAAATLYAAGARDGLDLLADGEISLATAAELAGTAERPQRKPLELLVEAALDKQIQALQEQDQRKVDLRRAEETLEILSVLKRHPELEAHLSRQRHPLGRLCKIWNSQHPNATGYVHTPLSQLYHLRPITVRKDGRNLTPAEQAALPENEGRRYIAAEWESAPAPAALLHAAPNPWQQLAVRHGKRIYAFKHHHRAGSLRFLRCASSPHRGIRNAA